MSDATHYIVATAGHVDHGKSALIKALTGTDPDRLPEEKARGITIDLGFAHLDLPSPATRPAEAGHYTSSIHVGIVDVPGHEDFVKNMVAGVGAIDLALLVVAADDGWMPQTEEHLQILQLLRRASSGGGADEGRSGGRRGRRRRRGPPASGGQRVCRRTDRSDIGRHRTGTRSVEGRRWRANWRTRRRRATSASRRLAVDRVFTLPGAGTVITGTLAVAHFSAGQTVVIQPGGHPARIRRIQSHGRDVEVSGPGTRTALNLTDVNPVAGVHRGDVITLPDMGAASDCLDVMLEISARASKP